MSARSEPDRDKPIWILLMVDSGIGLLAVWNILIVYAMATEGGMHDFARFYETARSFLEGREMYGTGEPFFNPFPDLYFQNLNPPHFHLLLLPLACLPRTWALLGWTGGGLVALLFSLKLTLDAVGWRWTSWRFRLAVLASLCFEATRATLVTGQLSFYLLLLVTLAWIAARRGRWLRAAALLGVGMSVKPFLGIFLPYLLLRRRWAALALSLATTLACFLLGLLVFGLDAHLLWLKGLGSVSWTWSRMNASIMGVVARLLSPNPFFEPLVEASHLVRPVWCILAVSVVAVTLIFLGRSVSWRTEDRDFTLLMLAAFLISPLGWTYYLWLPALPGLACILAGGFPGDTGRLGSRISLLLLWAAGPGLLCSVQLVTAMQPSSLATLTIGSIYFWSVSFLWVAFLLGSVESFPSSATHIKSVS